MPRSLFPALLLAATSLLLGGRSLAQHLPPAGHVYNDQSLSRITVLLPPDTVNALFDPANRYNDREFRATVLFRRGTQTDTLPDVGIRLRGNTSRNAHKQSFRLSFNSYQSGRRYHGLKDMNLVGSHNDPSVSRAKIYFDLCRQLGAPSTRAAHTELYLNNQYRGLYINTEHINDDFVQLRYGNSNGNLYKCLYPADLAYLSNNPNDYKFTAQGRRAYELTNNQAADDYTDLALLIRTLHQTPAADIYCALDTLFNIEGFLLAMAIDVSTGHWDAYYNKNNYYLYHNQATRKFEWLPYDPDNTFGIDWFNINWATIGPFSYAPAGQARPLYTKLMDNPQTRAIYAYYLKKVSQYLQQTAFSQQIDSLRNRISAAAQADHFRTLDYGYSYNDFLQAFTTTNANGHVKTGIKPFLQNRATATLNTIPANFNVPPIVHQWQVTQLQAGTNGWVKVRIEDEQLDSLNAFVRANWQGNEQLLPLFDDGLHQDGAAGDGVFGAQLPFFSTSGTLAIQFSVSDPAGNTRLHPCTPRNYLVRQGGPLYINEFVADNNSGIRDQSNAASDWIELYNSSTDPYLLAGHSLTDNFNNPSKWLFPPDTIAPGGYYLVWAASDTSRGPNHANFGLSLNGEEIGLYKLVGGQPQLLDSISFGPQQTDVSLGRLSDGAPSWVSFNSPTPLQANGFPNSTAPHEPSDFRLYPNPASQQLYIRFEQAGAAEASQLQVFDAQGRLMHQATFEGSAHQVPLADWPAGLYLLRITQSQEVHWKRFIKK